MRNQLAAYSLLLSFILGLALLALSGSMLLAATPILLALVASQLIRAPVSLLVSRKLSAHRVGPGTTVTVTVTITNNGEWVREAVARDMVPRGLRVVDGSAGASFTLRPRGEVTFEYSVQGDRGSYDFSQVRITTAGDLPLRSTTRMYDARQELVTLPHHRALSQIPIAPRRTLVYAGMLPARRGGEGTEFYDVRQYGGRGEPRRINWRLSARRPGEIYVNEFQEERVADVGIILDARLRAYPAANRDRLFESAANAAASLADVLLDQGNRVGYLGYGVSIDWITPGFGRAQKQRILTRIARVRPGDSAVFSRLTEIPERLLPVGSQLILVSPLTNDDALPVIRLVALRYTVLVVCPNPLMHDALAGEDETTAAARRIAMAERRVLAHRLRHAGVPVVDWDTRQPFETAISAALGQILHAWRHRSR